MINKKYTTQNKLSAFRFPPETDKKLFELAMVEVTMYHQISRVKVLIRLINEAYKKLKK